MAESQLKKIVYLFGAGATNAEISYIDLETDPNLVGLCMADVTKRVIHKTKGIPAFSPIEMFLKTDQDGNIELLISLLEKNSHDFKGGTETIIRELKDLVKQDIEDKLTDERLKQFLLHRGLLELHKKSTDKEILHGIISLNYDKVLDEAYEEIISKPDYGFSSERKDDKGIPLLKLHGSFYWNEIEILGKIRDVSIIPLGATKNYLRLPYNFIWGRALEILTECDILRVIGCSLSPNDAHLVDLLFKAHVLRQEPFEIQIISSPTTGDNIKGAYPFLEKIVPIDKIKGLDIPNVNNPNINIFAEWLKYFTVSMLKKEEIDQTIHLKKLIF